ncbi:MAG: hypothetical protein ACQPRJ_05330 [Solitalea-like symbiont of Acarus siro]
MFYKVVEPDGLLKFIFASVLISCAGSLVFTTIQLIFIDKLHYIESYLWKILITSGLILGFLSSLYGTYFIIKLKLILKINSVSIFYKPEPIHKKFKILNKDLIDNIQISGSHFHIGIGATGTRDYAIGNGNCITIHTTRGKKYLLSTGLDKDKLLEVLNKYGYKIS